MAYGPSYKQYLEAWNNNSAEDEAGNRPKPMSEEEFNNLDDAERSRISQVAGQMSSSDYLIEETDPLVAQFREKFGAAPEAIAGNKLEIGDQDVTGYRIGYGEPPKYGEIGWDKLAIDPSRILYLDPEGTPNRRYIYEGANRKPDAIVSEQAREADSGLGDNAWMMAALVVAPYLWELAAAAAPAEGAVASGAVGNAELALASDVAAGGGVTGGAGTAATTAATTAGGVAPIIETAPGLVESTAATTNALSGTPAITMPGVSGNMLTQGWQWYQNLSPAARQLIGSAVSTGASAALASSRQRDALEQRNNEIEQRRQDEIRRGSVPRQTTTYAQRPLPGGLVAYNMGQGGTG